MDTLPDFHSYYVRFLDKLKFLERAENRCPYRAVNRISRGKIQTESV